MNLKISKTNIVLGDQTFVSGMHFLIGIVLARHLGMSGYGEYILIYGVILFFLTWQANMLISPMMVKLPLFKLEEKNAYFWSSFVQQLILDCIVLIILFVGFKISALFLPNLKIERLLWPACGATVFCLAQDFFRKYFFTIDQPWAALINDLCCYGLQIIILLLSAAAIQIDSIFAIWTLSATSAIAVTLALFQTKCFNIWDRPSYSFLRDKIIENLHFGKWLLGGDLMYWVQNQFVNYFCAGILSVAMVGAMNAARNITGPVNVLFLGLMNFLPPRAAGAYGKGGRVILNSYLQRVAFWGGIITLVIVLVASIGRELWLQILYGSEYAGYGWIVIWWGAYYLIGFFQRPISVGLQVLNKPKGIFFSNLVGFMIMLAISYPLLIYWRVHGLMLLICINNAIVLINLYARYRHRIKTADSCILKKSIA